MSAEGFDLSKILAGLDAKIAAKKSSDNLGQNLSTSETIGRIESHNLTDKSYAPTDTTGDVRKKVEGDQIKLEEIRRKLGLEGQTEQGVLLSEKENESRNFIESNQQTVLATLTQLIKEKKFILVGEIHSSECAQLGAEVAKTLSSLKREGLTHVALETDSMFQGTIDSANYSGNDFEIMRDLKSNGVGNGWEDYHFNILITAKRLGIKIVLIDYHDLTEADTTDYAKYVQVQNERDAHMTETLSANLDEKSKVLVYIGTDHVERIEGGDVKRLYSHLSERYGKDQISSIRHVGQDDSFDCTHDGSTPNQIYSRKLGITPVIVPDTGPFKGNRNTDFINFIK